MTPTPSPSKHGILVPAILLVVMITVLLAGCTTAPTTPAPVTTPATPATTAPPATTVMTTVMTTVPPTTTVATTQTTIVTTVPTTPAIPGVVNVTIQTFAFLPATVTVPAGTTVTWTNKDSLPHTIVNDLNPRFSVGAMFSSGELQTGQQYSFTFKDPGSYGYHCSIHTYMKGTVVVT